MCCLDGPMGTRVLGFLESCQSQQRALEKQLIHCELLVCPLKGEPSCLNLKNQPPILRALLYFLSMDP